MFGLLNVATLLQCYKNVDITVTLVVHNIMEKYNAIYNILRFPISSWPDLIAHKYARF